MVESDDDGIRGRHCVMTGASGGIGEAIAGIVLARGAALTLVARPGERLEAACARLETASVALAVVRPDEATGL